MVITRLIFPSSVFIKWLLSGAVILLVACNKADGLVEDPSAGSQSTPTGVAAPLSNAEFQSLAAEKQYQVVNKLAGTMFKGVPADEFFDFNTYGSSLKVSDNGNLFLSNTRTAVATRLKNRDRYINVVDQRYDLGTNAQAAKAEPLALIREYPISRDQFEAWIAYVLMNTVLFSPAEEIDSTSYIDVQRIFDGLLVAMRNDTSISDIVLAHMKTQENWRRFRSPEDNTREMLEIYLGYFDRDADVVKASVTCKNWRLTDDNDTAAPYTLIVDDSELNSEPQKILGTWVTTCDEFYTLVATHSALIPKITADLVDLFFPASTVSKRSSLVSDIVAQGPIRFNDIFTAIVFSREYLMNNERPKNFEENFFNLADRLSWEQTNEQFLAVLTGNTSNQPILIDMKQPSMTMKLGRPTKQPFDTLSFSFYHKALREELLTGAENNWGEWGDKFVDKGDLFDTDDYIDFLFLSGISRKASLEERDTIKEVFVDTGNTSGPNYRRNQASIVFDYLSRLPGLYYFKKITAGEAQ